MDLNKAMIIGRLTRDPESRTTPQGTAVATVGIATNYTWTDQAGQKQEKVEYHNVVAWRRLAEICSQYLRKGSKVYFEGRLQTREWEGQDGVKRYRTEIIADNMIMLDGKGDGGTRSFSPSQPQSSSAPAPIAEPMVGNTEIPSMGNAPSADDEIKIENIPF